MLAAGLVVGSLGDLLDGVLDLVAVLSGEVLGLLLELIEKAYELYLSSMLL